MKIADLRQEYMRAGLAEQDAHADPLRQFERWLRDAISADVPTPNAMSLATVSTTGAPSARIVLLKGIENDSFVFYTNYESRKGRELAAHPAASLVFYWAELERQVRIDGRVERTSAQAADDYFASRPLGARLSSWASQQSTRVRDRRALEDALAQMSARWGEQPPRPPHWGGYRVIPESIEFWQGRANRLHDRLLYTRDGERWKIERLAP